MEQLDRTQEYLSRQLISYITIRHPDVFSSYDVYRLLFYLKAYFIAKRHRVLYHGILKNRGFALATDETDKELADWVGEKLPAIYKAALIEDEVRPVRQADGSVDRLLLAKTLHRYPHVVLGGLTFYTYTLAKSDILVSDRVIINQMADFLASKIKRGEQADCYRNWFTNPIINESLDLDNPKYQPSGGNWPDTRLEKAFDENGQLLDKMERDTGLRAENPA